MLAHQTPISTQSLHTAGDIARQLANRVDQVCAYLLPEGKKVGSEWCVGSIDGEKGLSLRVHLSGDKAGVWCDFADPGKNGDLLDLWAASRRLSLGQALQEAKKYLGLGDVVEVIGQPSYVTPNQNALFCALESSRTGDYLVGGRGIPPEAVRAYRLAATDADDGVVFPSYSPTGALVNTKVLKLDRPEGKKVMFVSPGCAPSLFGWQTVPSNARSVIITEGELDAISAHQLTGIPALSVPFGAGVGEKLKWIDYDWDNLQQFDMIYLWYDEDEEGQKTVAEVAKRLGLQRCAVIHTPKPHKDANDCLVAGVDVTEAVQAAKIFCPDEIKSPDQFLEKVLEWLNPDGTKAAGFFAVPLGRDIKFRPGEVTLWTGITGHGKSLLLGETMLFAVIQNELVAIASMEMPGQVTLGRMVRQLMAKDRLLPTETATCLNWLRGKMWLYDIQGMVKPAKLFELMSYSYMRHGVTQFVIDSLMKLDLRGDDYDGQRTFMNAAKQFATANNVHLHIVAHPRKPPIQGGATDAMEIKGSSDLPNQADNVLVVSRNKKKQEEMENGAAYSTEKPDGAVRVVKQRATGWEGLMRLWFDRKSTQLVDEMQIMGENINPYKLYRYVPAFQNRPEPTTTTNPITEENADIIE